MPEKARAQVVLAARVTEHRIISSFIPEPAMTGPSSQRNARVHDFVEMTEIDDGKALADPLFRRRYGTDAPDFPLHVFAFSKQPSGERGPVLCYIHFTVLEDVLLGGGACVDNRELRRLDASSRTAIREAGGLYAHALSWAVRHYSGRYKAIFGYCGDALAERIDLAVGFSKTEHRHLLVNFIADVDDAERARLVELAHAVGPF